MKKQLYKNAHIITMNNQLTANTMLVDEKGDIEFIGDSKDLPTYDKASVEEIDVNNKTIMPGFVNINSNIMNYARSLLICDISLINSLDKTIQALNKYFLQFKDRHQEFILAVGLDDSLFNENTLLAITNQYPQLDKKPLLLCNKEGDQALINEAMINLFKSLDKAESIKSYQKVNDKEAFAKLVPLIPNKSLDDVLECTKIALSNFAQAGITTCQDNLFDLNQLDIITNLAMQDENIIDLVFNLEITNFRELFPRIKDKLSGYSHGFRIAGLYIAVDGKLENQEAFITSSYQENSLVDTKQATPSGALIADGNLIAKSIQWALQQNTQIAFEANGDASLNFILKTLREQNPELLNTIRNKNAYLINSLSSQADLSALKLLGLSLVQPISNLWHFGDLVKQFLPDEATKLLFKANTALNQNINYTTYQDTLVNGFNMFELVWSMTNRKDRSLNLLNQAEIITTYDALMTITCNPAHMLFETKKGTLTQGKFADFIILNENPLTVDVGALSSIKVLATYKRGKAIYNALNKS